METKPIISIIVPIYNNEKYIRKAVDSCFRQDIAELEIILINDGSIDGSRKIIEELAAEYPQVKAVTQENSGVSAARNKGLDLADGEYIGFLDSDDEYTDGSLGQMLFLARRWKADLVVGEAKSVGTFQTNDLPQSKRLSNKTIIEHDDPDMIYNFSCCNKLFKRSVIEEHHLRFQKIRHAEDGLFLYSFICVCGMITGCPKYVYKYHKRIALEAKSALKNLDITMFSDAMEACHQIKEMTKEWPAAFQNEMDARILRVTVINEYYRRLWMLDQKTTNAVKDKIDLLRKRVGEERWAKINDIVEDLEIRDHVRSRQEISEKPLVSVILTDNLNGNDTMNCLISLFYQICPNYDVYVPRKFKDSLPDGYDDLLNYHYYDSETTSLSEVLSLSRGINTVFVNEPCLLNENSLQLMLRRLSSSGLDCISVAAVGYTAAEDGEILAGTKRRANSVLSVRIYRKEAALKTLLAGKDRPEDLLAIKPDKYYDNVILGVCEECLASLNSSSYKKKSNKKGTDRIKRWSYRLFASVLPIQKKKVLLLSDMRSAVGGNYTPLVPMIEKGGYHITKDFKVSKDAGEGRLARVKRMYHLATAGYILLEDFHADTALMNVRKGQELCQLWHAAGAYKRFAWGRDNGKEKLNISPSYSKYTKAITSSEEIRQIYADSFHIPLERVQATGLPRTDMLFDDSYIDKARQSLMLRYPLLESGKKIVLIAPTYRGVTLNKASYDYEKTSPEKLHELLGSDYIFAYKWHPACITNLRKKGITPYDFKACADYAVDLSEVDNVNDLMLISDILVTDYSSVIFEYSLLNKPIVYYWYDANQYLTGRGFYYDPEEYVFGPVAYTIEELADSIKNAHVEESKHQAFVERFMSGCDGHSTEKAYKWIFG